MEELENGLRERADENQARDRAISAFLDLGEKLKNLAVRGDKSRKQPAGEFLGASALFNTIEGEIIPRLMLAHRGEAAITAEPALPDNIVSDADRAAFLQAVLEDSASAARGFATNLLQRGVPRDVLLLDLLTSSARSLGEMWERDECDFTDVTIGLCRLHEIVRMNAAEIDPLQFAGDGPRILLATACGDQHVLGVIIVADFFRRAGWRVTSEPGASQDQLADILSDREFDILGLSAACTTIIDDLAEEIRVLRAASRKQDLKILAGGRLFAEKPTLYQEIGADAYADDPKMAAEIGRSLLAANAAHC